jgi:hypothetical protein
MHFEDLIWRKAAHGARFLEKMQHHDAKVAAHAAAEAARAAAPPPLPRLRRRRACPRMFAL